MNFLPTLKLNETSYSQLKSYEDIGKKQLTKEIIRMWQEGDYPLARVMVASLEGEELWNELLPYESLSRNERLLLRMEWTGNKEKDLTSWQNIVARMNVAGVTQLKGYSDVQRIWHSKDKASFAALYKRSKGKDSEFVSLLRSEFLPMFASPVTGTFFEPWHREWKRGMGYIFQVLSDADLSAIEDVVRRTLEIRVEIRARESLGVISRADVVEERVEELEVRFLESYRPAIEEGVRQIMDQSKFFYFRVYGEREGTVIAEGLWRVRAYEKLSREEKERVSEM